jgi:regulator of nucleoside diphosphate kinase
MRGNHTIDLPSGEGRPSVVLDVAHLERLRDLATSRAHGGARLARLLAREAARTGIVPAGRMPADVVGFGSEVTYRDEATGTEHTIVLVPPQQADIGAGRVSVLSPVGTALIGRSEGAAVACEFPAGTMRRLAVLKVAAERSAPPRAATRQPRAESCAG